ncbi:MAG: O-antigen ligase family protein [Atopobiaceae bacterium]|nr:O-antigen ligase family protein [Atopobiaceae bacterium]
MKKTDAPRTDVLRGRILPWVATAAAVFYVAFYISYHIFPRRSILNWTSIYRVVTVCCIVVCTWLLFERKSKAAWLPFLNVGWMAVSRMLLGDNPLQLKGVTNLTLVYCMFFAIGACMERKRRDLLMELVTLEVVAMLTTWAIIGIPTVITGRTTLTINRIALHVGRWQPLLVYVKFFDFHRNTSAAFFVWATGMLLDQCARTRNSDGTHGERWLFWRIVSAVFIPLAYLCVTFQHSRSNQLAFAVMSAIAIVAAIQDRFGTVPDPEAQPIGEPGETAGIQRVGKPRLGLVASACLALVCGALVFSSFNPCGEAILNATSSLREEMGSEEMIDMADAFDERDILHDMGTFSGRFGIWRTGLAVMADDPAILLRGSSQNTLMDQINMRLDSDFHHMHNMLMERLMSAGIPGLAILVAFLIALLRRMLICARAAGDPVLRPARALAAPVAAILAYGIFEPVLGRHLRLISLLFALSAGLFIRETDDSEPA